MNLAVYNHDLLKEQLTKLIADLPQMSEDCLFFGDPASPHSVGVMVKYQDTLGGRQFRICTVSSRGFGGGAYYPPAPVGTMAAQRPIDYAMRLVDDYCRPLPPNLQERFGKKTDHLVWFRAPMAFPKTFPVLDTQDFDATVITLSNKREADDGMYLS